MTSARSAAGTGLPKSTRRKKRARPSRIVLSSADRLTLEDEIERLIAILDLADPDPDLEETGDLEPSLGAYHGNIVDAEMDPSDDEPSLGSFDGMIDQAHWCSSAFVNGPDLELDLADREPWLGAPEIGDGNQTCWAKGDCRDLEMEARP